MLAVLVLVVDQEHSIATTILLGDVIAQDVVASTVHDHVRTIKIVENMFTSLR